MARQRDLLLILGLFAGLALFIVLMPDQAEQERTRTITTTHSSGPNGALALLRWTRQLGYDAQRLEYTDFALSSQTDALFMLNPSRPVLREQADAVLAWVEQGGTLILADERNRAFASSNLLLEQLEVEVVRYSSNAGDPGVSPALPEVPILQPVFDQPPLATIPVQADQVIRSPRTELVALAGVPDGVVVAGMRYGLGYIYVSASGYPFTNVGLRDERSAGFVLNILNRLPRNAAILFDEYHHGFVTEPSLRHAIFTSAWGWALLYGVGVVGLYLLATGRRFGTPIPLREDVAQRNSAEYVESMADLMQRGKQRRFIAQHYHTMLKRRLARPYGLNPRLADAEFVAELRRYRELDADALLHLLHALQRTNLTEQELLHLVTTADAIPER